MTLDERIRAYVAKMPVAVSGQGGSNACLAVACVLIWGWDLSPSEAMVYLREYSATCSPPWTEKELEHKLRSAEKKPPTDGKVRGYLRQGREFTGSSRPAAVSAPVKKVERAEWAKVNREAVANLTAGMPELDFGWFSRRSPVDVSKVGTAEFLSAVFGPEERVLIFTNYYSQGDFIFWRGRFFRMSAQEGVQAVACDAPTSGKKGVWYLVQPVSGAWEIGDRVKDGVVLKTRRSEKNVTAWRHVVLESDEADFENEWLKVVARLSIPVVALYTSGGRSIHALVRYPVGSKAEWDAMKATLQQVVCPLGADPGALSAVRLSRLPGCLREGADDKDGRYVRYGEPRMQRLIYLNPEPTFASIWDGREVRE
jgi:hypothetical protein